MSSSVRRKPVTTWRWFRWVTWRSLTRYLEHRMFTPWQRDNAAERVGDLIRLIEAGEWDQLRVRLPDDPSLEEAISADGHDNPGEEAGGP